MIHRLDRFFLIIVWCLSLFGFFIFASASLGLLGRSGARWNAITLKQLGVLVVGLFLFLVVSRINFKYWRQFSLVFFILSALFSLLVFVPGIGFLAGGARRWIILGPLSLQPSEFLKLGFLLYLAARLSGGRSTVRVAERPSAWPLLLLLAVTGGIIAAQPDFDTLVIVFVAGLVMFFVAGASWRQILLIILLVLGVLSVAALSHPYILTRLHTFLDPDTDQLNSAYQINQSLIAIGAGGLTGRGFGQSLQKFRYLPEPIGDSVFSVASEEFGFLGGVIIIALFLVFTLIGLKIAVRTTNRFARLLTVGIVTMIVTGAFINIAAMLGLIPLTGTPLLFISNGGTALLLALIEAGIVLNIARQT